MKKVHYSTEREMIADFAVKFYGKQINSHNMPSGVVSVQVLQYFVDKLEESMPDLVRKIVPIVLPGHMVDCLQGKDYFPFNMFNNDDLPAKHRRRLRSRKKFYDVSLYPEIFRMGVGKGEFHFVVVTIQNNCIYPIAVGSVPRISEFVKYIEPSIPQDGYDHYSSTHYIPKQHVKKFITYIRRK